MELLSDILEIKNSKRFINIECPNCTRESYCNVHNINRYLFVHFNMPISESVIMLHIAYNCRLHKKINVIYLSDMTYSDREPHDYLLYLYKPNGCITKSKYLLYVVCMDTHNIDKNMFIYLYAGVFVPNLPYAVYLSSLVDNIKLFPNVLRINIRYRYYEHVKYIRRNGELILL
jgi:hypothetical protein